MDQPIATERSKAVWLVGAAVALSCLLSALALYFKLYFWGGTDYAPWAVKLAIWFVIVAGPLAAITLWRRPMLALGLCLSQFALVAYASLA